MTSMKPYSVLTKRYASIIVAACLLLGTGMSRGQVAPSGRTTPASFPTQLTDKEFWSLSKDSSEDDGFFRSDNLLSNENSFQYIIPQLLKSARQGRVYLGVGPEQN